MSDLNQHRSFLTRRKIQHIDQKQGVYKADELPKKKGF